MKTAPSIFIASIHWLRLGYRREALSGFEEDEFKSFLSRHRLEQIELFHAEDFRQLASSLKPDEILAKGECLAHVRIK